MLSVNATGSTSELDGLISRLSGASLQGACNDAGHAIQARYEAEAPKDTTSMSLSVYVHGADGQSDYAERTAAADSVNPKVVILPELPAPPAPGVVVGVAASHGAPNEYGFVFTTKRGKEVHRAARPTFTPAVEEERERFPERVRAAVWGR